MDSFKNYENNIGESIIMCIKFQRYTISLLVSFNVLPKEASFYHYVIKVQWQRSPTKQKIKKRLKIKVSLKKN